jgi:hypothetical protein
MRLIDGEVAMLLPDGRTSFAALQKAAAGTTSHASLVYFVFDLIRLNGERIDRLPLEERKADCARSSNLPRRSRRPVGSAMPTTSSATANNCWSMPRRSARRHHFQTPRSPLLLWPSRRLAQIKVRKRVRS